MSTYVSRTYTSVCVCACVSHLKEESIPERVAKAEDKLFLGVFRHSLDDAVLHPQRVFRNAVVVDAGAAV